MQGDATLPQNSSIFQNKHSLAHASQGDNLKTKTVRVVTQKTAPNVAATKPGPTSFAAASAAGTLNPSVSLKLKISRRPSLTASQGKDDDEEEADPAVEEHFLLRLPKGKMCDDFRQAVKSRAVPEDTSFTFKSDRGAVFAFNGEKHAAQLVDLPTIVESHKTLDNKQLYKIADICQMLIVQPAPLTDENVVIGDPDEVAFPDGITPPLKHVRKRRFRKRVSKKTIEVVEREVERLLQEDAGAEEVKFEVQDLKEDAPSDSEMGTPAPKDEEDLDEDGFFNENGSDVLDGEDSDFDMELADVAAEIERQTGGKDQGNNDDDDDDDDEDDNDDDEEEDEDGDQDRVNENDEVSSARTMLLANLNTEIRDMESAIERKLSDLANASNAIIKKRFGDVIEKMKEELDLKRKELASIT